MSDRPNSECSHAKVWTPSLGSCAGGEAIREEIEILFPNIYYLKCTPTSKEIYENLRLFLQSEAVYGGRENPLGLWNNRVRSRGGFPWRDSS
jgi:hypothetical protein